jgi:predicted deacetylase
VYFCIRDDDTSFFTSPNDLESIYGDVSLRGPVSLAVVPFHRAGTSKGVPEKYRGQWSVHPLHSNRELVEYLRVRVAQGRYEIMLHGYHHDEPHGGGEFSIGNDLRRKVAEGRQYLEDLLCTVIRVFVPPRNAIAREGLKAVINAGLHLAGTAGIRAGWPLYRRATWVNWYALRKWQCGGGLGIPWILNLGNHHEIAGNGITPVASFAANKSIFENTLRIDGVFCAATHYWEVAVPSIDQNNPTVGEHLRYLVDRAQADPRVIWKSVGEIVCDPNLAR